MGGGGCIHYNAVIYNSKLRTLNVQLNDKAELDKSKIHNGLLCAVLKEMSCGSYANKTAMLSSTGLLDIIMCVTVHHWTYAGDREGRMLAIPALHYYTTLQYSTLPHITLSHLNHCVLWSRKVHRRVHKSPLLVSIHSEINPVKVILPHLRSVLILSWWNSSNIWERR